MVNINIVVIIKGCSGKNPLEPSTAQRQVKRVASKEYMCIHRVYTVHNPMPISVIMKERGLIMKESGQDMQHGALTTAGLNGYFGAEPPPPPRGGKPQEAPT